MYDTYEGKTLSAFMYSIPSYLNDLFKTVATGNAIAVVTQNAEE